MKFTAPLNLINFGLGYRNRMSRILLHKLRAFCDFLESLLDSSMHFLLSDAVFFNRFSCNLQFFLRDLQGLFLVLGSGTHSHWRCLLHGLEFVHGYGYRFGIRLWLGRIVMNAVFFGFDFCPQIHRVFSRIFWIFAPSFDVGKFVGFFAAKHCLCFGFDFRNFGKTVEWLILL